MKANETKLQQIIEGMIQYVVPLFQRKYSWGAKEWNTLWDDLIELFEDGPAGRNHFIGSIVTMPTQSVPEEVGKFLLIDGQQRFTTVHPIPQGDRWLRGTLCQAPESGAGAERKD